MGKILNTLAALLAVSALQGCIPMVAAIPIGLAAAVPADRAVNQAIGGTPGHTISGDTAIARNNGSESAKGWCSAYEVVSWYDAMYFNQASWKVFNERKADHCERWRLYESGELAKAKEQAI